ncbi:MAG: DEDD exonuclease domain-containing protein [Brachybacterium sp.]|uniref:DEDD exonuclease domain-containing protein n=1 Tax=Brachybacterium sp. TaxID=1891286 RepID=UPI002655BE5D|nr:DEDD exonuclease domain-containing protein [Brachybacterium sp.]MDN6328111.1 DEDD exonuclease domain-containing protein [Brachybacterium sp.]
MSARRQLSFDDLGTPLAEATLVVVDLETTGTDPSGDAITEIGAVKVRGGEVLGEFRTFVDPERPIPAYIAALTGITDASVAEAPSIRTVLPMFLDFVGDAALVAHNARFDIGFLSAQAAVCEIRWPGPRVLDTLALARTVFRRDEVRDHKLSTLARHVGASIAPDHRALSDARATVDVLHAIIERLGAAGASTLEDLGSAHRRATPTQLRKKHLAADVPPVPGVYQFLDAQGSVLYVGTSRNLRSRVRTYFTAAETRRTVLDMLPRAESIRVIECATPTEAGIRELRIIAREQPPSNRHGLNPQKAHWLRLGPGGQGLRAARLAKVETDGSAQIGPLASRHEAEPLRALLTDAMLGRGAAFENPAHREVTSSGHRARLRRALLEDPSEVLDHVAARLRAHVDAGRYEEAEKLRRLAHTYLAAARRASRLRALAEVPLLIAARPSTEAVIGGRGWELLAVRHGRFSGTTLVASGKDPLPFARSLELTGTGEAELAAPLCQGYHQEAEILLTWLEGEGVRTVLVDGAWQVPARARFDQEHLARRFARTAEAVQA